ncbi:MAG: O-antigen ligase family protein [Cyclobacteriaceae bacterium]|nr:O-antigen ligase family protein [Cyclobacteriaceae bacterium]
MTQLLFYALIGGGLILILLRPYWGIVLLFVSVALTETLPEFPFIDSIFPIFGLATVLGFLVKSFQSDNNLLIRIEWNYIFALIFVLWILISNPTAAISGGTRNWIFTFIQLFVLALLTGILMNDQKKFNTLMFWFVVALGISAFNGILNSSIAGTRMGSDIEAGLLGGKNTAARYYIVAGLFAFYLQKISKKALKRWFMRFAMAVLIIGVLFTLSRAGLALLVFSIGLVAFLEFRFSWRQFVPVVLMTAIIMFIIPDELFSTYYSVISGGEFETGGRGAVYSSVENNIRYTLWDSAFKMWKSAPVTGLGIGQFSFNVAYYLPFSLAYLNLGAHNMFFQLLAETGTVGVGLFLLTLLATYRNFSGQREGVNNINRIWMIAFVVMVLGGLTKHDHYDKLLWLLVGSSVALKNYWPNIKTQLNGEN